MRSRAFVVVVVASGLVTLLPPHAGATSDSPSIRAFRAVNRDRAARGLTSLGWDDRLAAVALSHSQDMAADGELRHNVELPRQVSGWSRLGENVGTGSTVDLVHEAFMDSAAHRDNILDRRFADVGVGVVEASGQVWVTQVYFTPMRSAAPRARTAHAQRTPPRRRAGGTVPVRPAPPRADRPAGAVRFHPFAYYLPFGR